MRAAGGEPEIPGLTDLVPVGRGGFGTVYRAKQPDMRRDVAVKFIASPGTPEEAVQRWRREVSAMGRLSNHPNILPVYAGGVTADGAPYLVMPYVPDGSLGDRLRREGPLAPGEVVELGRKLAGALATAHGAGVLHRDLKPDNVLLSPYGEPQLSDFGISRLVDATATFTGSVQASLPYAPPEVLTGAPATAAADVYGLGATLFACLTGAPPFPGRPEESLVAHVGRIASEDPPDLRAAGVPAALAEVIDRTLVKDPARRIGSADELRLALSGLALGPTGGARPGADGAAGPPTEAFTPGPWSDEATRATPAADATSVAAAAPPAGTGVPAASARPRPAAPATAPPGARRPERPGAGGGARRAGVVVGAVVIAVLVGAIALVLLDDGDPGDEAAPGDGTVATDDTAPAEGDGPDGTEATEPPGTASTVVPTPTTAPGDGGTATTVAAPAAPPATELSDAAERYVAALRAGDLDSAYDLLSPGLQAAQPRSAFEAFWGGAGAVELVGEPRVDEGSRTVTLPLAIGGSREDFTLRFLPSDDDGGWLVDGPRPR